MALSALERTALADLRSRLVLRFGERLVRFVLFGSRARGRGHEESDLDVLVLVRGLSRDERRGAVEDAGEVEEATGLVVSPIVRAAEAWRDDTPLGRAIQRDGVTP